MNKGFYVLMYIVIGLTASIFAGLLYLVASGGTQKLAAAAATSSAAVVTSSPISTSSASATPVPTATPAPSAAPAPTASAVPDTSSDSSMLRIVNATHTIDENYVPSDLVQPDVLTNDVQYMRKEAADAMEKMFAAAKADGVSLYFISGYRSYELQTSLYYTYIDLYGRDYAESIDDKPGASEHQLGLSADIGAASGACELDNCFDETAAYTWLAANSYKYGYVMRYPEGKESVTGIAYSPWAVRYIGSDAVKVYESGLTLEEYYSVK